MFEKVWGLFKPGLKGFWWFVGVWEVRDLLMGLWEMLVFCCNL